MDASILNRLGDIEAAAQKVLAETDEKKAELQKAAEQRMAEFDASMDAVLKEKLDALRTQLDSQNKQKLERLIRDADAQLARIDEHYGKQLESRAQAIIKQVLT